MNSYEAQKTVCSFSEKSSLSQWPFALDTVNLTFGFCIFDFYVVLVWESLIWTFSQTQITSENSFLSLVLYQLILRDLCFMQFSIISLYTWSSTGQCMTVRLTLTLFHHCHHLLQLAVQVILSAWMCFSFNWLPPWLLYVCLHTFALPLEIWFWDSQRCIGYFYCCCLIISWIFVLPSQRRTFPVSVPVESWMDILGYVQQNFVS